jgi:hypothetical protein
MFNHSFYYFEFLWITLILLSHYFFFNLIEPFFVASALLLFLILIVLSESYLISLFAFFSLLIKVSLLSIFNSDIAYTKTSHLLFSNSRK